MLFAGAVLAGKIPGPEVSLKSRLRELAQEIGHEENVLERIYQSDKEIIAEYFTKDNHVNPFKIQNFSDKKLRADVARKYLENDKREIASVIGYIPEVERVTELLNSLPHVDAASLSETLSILTSEIDKLPKSKSKYAL